MSAPSTSPPPISELLAGSLAQTYGAIPMIELPGDEVLYTSFIHKAATFITMNQNDQRTAPHLFRRDLIPVFPAEEARRLEPMKPEYFVSWCDRHFAPFKTRFDRKGQPFEVVRPMTKDVAKSCLESYEFQSQFKKIERIYPAPIPVIDAAGDLKLCKPGYEPSTFSYVFASPFEQRDDLKNAATTMVGSDGYYDDNMTMHEASTYLYNLHQYFPFSDRSGPICPADDNPLSDPDDPKKEIRLSRSLAVQIMGMLAIFGGGCVPQAASRLGFLYNANKQRSGKSLLAKLLVSPIFGSFKGQPWRENDEEMQKLLDAEVLAASPYICLDNIRGLIASPPLESFMTSPSWTGRVLGRSEKFSGENNALLLLTGNNCSVGADISERVLICDLYVENADRQEGKDEIDESNLLDDVWLSIPENRRKILSCLWTIIRHWNAAGRPQASGQPRRGFETWCRTFAGMVEFAGFGDPLAPALDLDNCGDNETNDFAEMVRLASADSPHRELSFQEVVHLLWEHGLLPWLMHGREEYLEEIGKPTFKLNDSANAKLGMLLNRNCAGERGEIHTTGIVDGKRRRVKVFRKGKGRARRFHFEEIKTYS